MSKKLLTCVSILSVSLLTACNESTPDTYTGYEYDANSAAECVAGEQYDAQAGVCYADFDQQCSTEAECEQLDKLYGDILDDVADDYKQNDTLPAKSDNTIAVSKKTQLQDHVLSVPEIMKYLVPSEPLKQITKYVEETDGVGNMLAFVKPQNKDFSQWKLGYDTVDAYTDQGDYKNLKELLTTLIHEYSHIKALSSQQIALVDFSIQSFSCEQDQTYINEGCAKNTSYIHLFAQQFWTPELQEKARQAKANETQEQFVNENYTASDYVTRYAASELVEDLSESFAFFVLRQRVVNPTTVADKKINFFYQFPELVKLRQHMRIGVGKVTKRYEQAKK